MGSARHKPQGLEILHEDRDVIVVNKQAGLLTIGTGNDKGRTAHAALCDYVSKGNPKSPHRVFVVHRLDRDTSGVLVFARSEAAKFTLQDNWDKASKTYLAVVDGRPPEEEGMISTYLAENAAGNVYSTGNPSLGRLSHTGYKVLRAYPKRTLLELHLLTGRKHQIRVHMADLGCPIVGDPRYGTRARGCKRLALHALTLSFDHPWNGRRMTFSAPVPASFHAACGFEPPVDPA